jgi:multidrug efflux pump subunit AcrB
VVTVTAETHGRDLGGVTRDVAAAVAGVPLPPGYRLELGGQQAAQREAFRNLLGVAVGGVLLTLLVLVAQFRRIRPALAVLATAPFALVGALVTLRFTATPLDVSSLMGCILLVGLEVKSGILLLELAQAHAATGMDPAAAVVAAGRRRIRPIMLTTTATLFGVLPLAVGLGAGTDVLRPLALAVLGGIALSKFVNLVALPALAVLVGLGRPDLDADAPRAGVSATVSPRDDRCASS